MIHDQAGLLAIWSTISAEHEVDYLHWLTREHIFERVGVPGFQSGRVLKRRAARPSEYMMLYELDNAAVMASSGYLARLNDPTPWTQRIMPKLERFRRGGGSIVAQAGNSQGHGGQVAIARFDNALPDSLSVMNRQEMMTALLRLDRIANVQLMSVTNDATSIATQEKSLRRSAEGEFSGLLVIEAIEADALDRAIKNTGVAPDAFEIYELIFTAHSR